MNLKSRICEFIREYNMICNAVLNSESGLIFDVNIYAAVICAEDKYFFKHKGVSFKSIIRALIKRHGGASTITMQMVRVLSGRYELSVSRKVREALLSFLVECKCKKIPILNCYMNHSYLGTKLTGVQSAIDKFFDGGSHNMSILDCCFVASLLKRPAPSEVSISWAYKINARMSHVNKIILKERGVIHLEIIESTRQHR